METKETGADAPKAGEVPPEPAKAADVAAPDETAKASEEAAKPADETAKAAEESAKPAQESAKPAEESAKPAEGAAGRPAKTVNGRPIFSSTSRSCLPEDWGYERQRVVERPHQKEHDGHVDHEL